jgi:ABC-type lipoprotein release transport system permease subunit
MSIGLSIRLGWRSFLRHKRRSIITGLAIALSLGLMLFTVGFSRGTHETYIEQGVRFGAGHVVVQGKGYQQEQTLDRLVADPETVARVARQLPAVRHVATRLRAEALISAGEHSAAIGVTGVDPAAERSCSELPNKRVAGQYLRRRGAMKQRNAPADIYLGAKLAKKLEVQLGDRVVLTVSPRGSGKTRAAAFRVRGLFRSGVAELDAFYAEIPLGEARRLLGVGEGATQVALLLDSYQAARGVARRLSAKLEAVGVKTASLEVLPWQVALRELYDGLVLDKGSMYVMLSILFVIIVIGIFNTMLMSVIERTRELGVMMAIGTSRGRLFSIVLAEAATLAAISSAIGLALGFGVSSWLASTGIDITKLAGDMEFAGVTISGLVYPRLTGEAIAVWTAAMIVLVLLSALYPAYRATRLQPVDAMRHV